MTTENGVRVFAGIMTLISVALVYFVSPWWLLFTAFIGLQPDPIGLHRLLPRQPHCSAILGCKDTGASCGTDVK